MITSCINETTSKEQDFEFFVFVMLLLLSSFSEFFPSISYTTPPCSNSQLSYTTGSYYFSGCSFVSLPIMNNGGAIYLVSSSASFFVIENSYFYNCVSKTKGGAIHFSCSKGGIVINRICGYQITTQGASDWDTGGIFSFTLTSNDCLHKFQMVSVASCICEQFEMICSHKGNQEYDNLNSSSHSVKQFSGFYSYQSTATVKWATFFNDTSSSAICVGFRYTTGYNYLQNSNVIKNNSPGGYGVVYSGAAQTYVQDCTFYQNKNTLFVVITSGFLKVQNCMISHDYEKGAVSFENTMPYVGSYEIIHFSSALCYHVSDSKPSFNKVHQFRIFTIFQTIIIAQ